MKRDGSVPAAEDVVGEDFCTGWSNFILQRKKSRESDLDAANTVKFNSLSFTEKTEKPNINEKFLGNYSGLLQTYKLVKSKSRVKKF